MHADKRQMLLDLTHSLQLHPTKAHVLWELSNCISSAVGADSFRLYLAENGSAEALNLYIGHDLMENGEPRMQKVRSNSHSVPTYVARTREAVRLSKSDSDPRFPDSFDNDVSNSICVMQKANRRQKIMIDFVLRIRSFWFRFFSCCCLFAE